MKNKNENIIEKIEENTNLNEIDSEVQNEIKNEETNKRKKNLKRDTILFASGIIGVSAFIGFSVLWAGRTAKPGEIKDGFITNGEYDSALYQDLFYYYDDKYMIDIAGLDKLTSMDCIQTEEKDGYVINNTYDQIIVFYDKDSYLINSSKISEDKNYRKPIIIKEKVYVDTDSILDSVGYRTDYELSADSSLVRLKIEKINDRFKDVKVNKITEKQEIDDEKQIEESMINDNNSPSINNPGKENLLPIVPQPSKNENNNEKNEIQSTEDLNNIDESEMETEIETENSGNETEENTEEETEEETESPLPPIIEDPNRKTDAEFDKIWKEDKSELKDVYTNSSSNFGQESYTEFSENFITFNTAAGAVYGNTIAIVKDPQNGDFMDISILNDWSDQAMNVVSEESKKYYQGVPEVIRRTLITTLGKNTGTELFNYIKTHADKTINGGYISQINPETNKIESVWTDGPVGDGIQASELDLSPWQHRLSDDDLFFDVCKQGDGLIIQIYKK